MISTLFLATCLLSDWLSVPWEPNARHEPIGFQSIHKVPIGFVLDTVSSQVSSFDDQLKLDSFEILVSIRNAGEEVAAICDNGDVIYNTNDVQAATRDFWNVLSAHLKARLNQQ